MTKIEFIQAVIPGAIDMYWKFQILPSITLAQACLESGWGLSGLAIQGKNLFGIKWTSTCGYDKILMPTWEFMNNAWIKVDAYFRKYDSWDISIYDHGKFLTAARYAKVRAAIDYKIACQELSNAGYATSPAYAKSLIDLINLYKFYQYDAEVLMFKDFNMVSDWAKPSVERMESLGIIKGDEQGNFNPKGTLTREQLAVVIDRVLKILGK